MPENRADKNRALAHSARGKTQTPTAEAARRAPNKETSGGSVKVVPPTSSLARDIKNIKETGKVLGAKEGTTARAAAALRVRTTGGLGGGGTLRNVIR